LKYNSDFKYDLEFGVLEGETWFDEIVSNRKFEVKTDRLSVKTGNIYIEYESRGKPSGIATTQADYWVYKVTETKAIVIKTEELKTIVRQLILDKKAIPNVRGGDNNTSVGVLVKIKDLV
jgi:ribosomal protein S4E